MWRLALALAVGCGRIGFGDWPGITGDGARFGDGETVKLDGQVASANLVAWYPMDELQLTMSNAIKRAPDVTGHGHDGTCATGIQLIGATCPTLVPGRIGNAYQFSGTTSRIDVGGAVSLELTAGYTIAMWISFDSTPSYGCPASQPLGSAGYESWQLCISSSGSPVFAFATGGMANALMPLNAIPVGSWHHLAIRWDGTTDTLLVDGASIAKGPGMSAFDGQDLHFGIDTIAGTVHSPYGGRIDDLRIYDAALTDADIALLAQ